MTYEEKDLFYKEETRALLQAIGEDEVNRLFSYEYCECDYGFVGFLENYADLADLPKDFAVIDIGSYQSWQGAYFKDNALYIGVEPGVPVEDRLRQDNALYFQESAQKFFAETYPALIENGTIDPDKVFAVCSAVPDREVKDLVAENFERYRISYPGEKTLAVYPKGFEPAEYFADTEHINRKKDVLEH